jgi:hypothetical protein
MSPSALRCSTNSDGLEQRMRSVARWVSARLSGSVDPVRLRTRDLLPVGKRLRDSEAVIEALAIEPWGLVESIATGRRLPLSLPALELPGRLMVYFPHLNLRDGAAELESGGFFDLDNSPPWDTWVAVFEDQSDSEPGPYVIAWVPEPLIGAAEAGIAVNPEGCIVWLDESEVAAKRLFARLCD